MCKFFQSVAVLTLTFVILSCSQKPASIEFKGYTFYGKDYYTYNDEKENIKRKDLRASNTEEKKPEKKEEIVKEKKEAKVVEITGSSACKIIPQGTEQIKVKYGDTLYGLAIKHNVSVDELIKLNGLKEPYILKEGQKLTISAKSLHIVKSGENLSVIAKNYNVKSKDIIELNSLEKPYIIKVGQKLKLPSGYKCAQTNVAKAPTKTKKVTKSIVSPVTNETMLVSKTNSFIWPIKGQVISKFGPKDGGLYNDGINVSAPKSTPFKATEDGVVAYIGNELKGYGNLIIIKHSNNWVSAYAHADEIAVKKGASVKKGDVIGKIGQTGNVATPQLYFGLRKGRKALDPERYLN